MPPILDRVVGALTGGETPQDAAAKARELTDTGRLVALEHAPGDDPDRALADLEHAMSLVADDGLAPVVEVIVLPEAIDGQLARILALGRDTGIAVTIGLGPRSDLHAHLALRAEHPGAGITLPAAWRRTERHCATDTGRIRIVKGTDDHGLAPSERFSHDLEVDKAFVRAAKALIARAGADVTPVLATHDGRLIEIAQSLAARRRLPKGAVEFAMHPGRASGLQERLVATGESVRVTVPFGPGRIERLAAGVLERPGGIAGAVRSILG